MKKNLSLVLPLAALMAFGAGCAAEDSTAKQGDLKIQNDTYAYDKNQAPVAKNDQAEPPKQAVSDQQQAPAPTPTPATSTPTTPPKSMNEQLAFPGVLPESETNKLVHLKTTKGDIVFEMLPKEGPNAASNFAYLTKRKFYDGLTFHRVVPGFVIQGGDPEGTGMGGPGYRFEDDKVNLQYKAGIVAMANAGPNTNGSQFFIMLEDNPLPPQYSIFGRVVTGLDVVRKISVGDKMLSVTLEDKK